MIEAHSCEKTRREFYVGLFFFHYSFLSNESLRTISLLLRRIPANYTLTCTQLFIKNNPPQLPLEVPNEGNFSGSVNHRNEKSVTTKKLETKRNRIFLQPCVISYWTERVRKAKLNY